MGMKTQVMTGDVDVGGEGHTDVRPDALGVVLSCSEVGQWSKRALWEAAHWDAYFICPQPGMIPPAVTLYEMTERVLMAFVALFMLYLI